jgi:hypothetical protein
MVPEHRADEDANHRAAQVVIPRQPIPKPMRQRQHPLTYRHRREHMVDQVRGAISHAAATTAGTQRAPLARERHEPIQPTVSASKTGEAPGQEAATQERPEFLLDEPRQPFSVADARSLGAERLVVVAGHLVQDVLHRDPRLILHRWRGHVAPRAHDVPPDTSKKTPYIGSPADPGTQILHTGRARNIAESLTAQPGEGGGGRVLQAVRSGPPPGCPARRFPLSPSMHKYGDVFVPSGRSAERAQPATAPKGNRGRNGESKC